MVLAAGQEADVVDPQVGDVAGEQAILERRPAAVEKVERGPGRLRAVVAEDAVAKENRIVRSAEMLDRDAAAARAGVVVGDLDVLDRRIGARVDLDGATV